MRFAYLSVKSALQRGSLNTQHDFMRVFYCRQRVFKQKSPRGEKFFPSQGGRMQKNRAYFKDSSAAKRKITPMRRTVLWIVLSVRTLGLQSGARSECIKSASCCAALVPCVPRYMSFLRLAWRKFYAFLLCGLKRRKILHFQGGRKKRTGSMPMEDNAGN